MPFAASLGPTPLCSRRHTKNTSPLSIVLTLEVEHRSCGADKQTAFFSEQPFVFQQQQQQQRAGNDFEMDARVVVVVVVVQHQVFRAIMTLST